MQRTQSPRLRSTVTAVLLCACAAAVACSRAAEPATTAPPAEPPPPPAAPPAAAQEPAPAEAAKPEAPPPERAAPRDLLDEEREQRATTGHAEAGPNDLQSAQAELERARVELNRALGSPRSRAAKSAPAPTSAGGANRGAAAAAPAPQADKKASEESSCSTACRAFSSLERAAGAVCRIAGEKDGRCGHAHAVLADAQKRVAVCSCTAE